MSGIFNVDVISRVKTTVRVLRVKHKLILSCFAYVSMLGEVNGQVVTHDCPAFTERGASQPGARLECEVHGTRLLGLYVVNRDYFADASEGCLCSREGGQ